jgi:DNA repair protein RecO (recombination protein O)
MTIRKATAFVLHKNALKEYDEIVTLLSRERGLLSLVCRGTRRTKGKNRGLFEVPHLLDLVYYEKEGRELGNLNQAEILRSYGSVRERLESLVAALFFADLTRMVLLPADPHADVFKLLEGHLAALEAGGEPWRLTLSYVLRLLPPVGFAPEVSRCLLCRGTSDRELNAFSAMHGGLLCDGCRLSDEHAVRLTGLGVHLLRRFYLEALPDWDEPLTRIKDAQLLRRALVRFLEAQVGGRCRSLRFLEEVEGE